MLVIHKKSSVLIGRLIDIFEKLSTIIYELIMSLQSKFMIPAHKTNFLYANDIFSKIYVNILHESMCLINCGSVK